MQCSMEAPYFDGHNCITCDEGLLFNAETKKCEECPKGETFVLITHHCQEPSVTDPDEIDRVMTADPASLANATEADVPCPEDMPFFNGEYCIACDDKNAPLFNADTGKCDNCPDG
jgi:hypothetical protein